MRVIDCVQGSPEWHQSRAGKITASRICDVLDVLKKGGESAKRRAYKMQLLAERLTGLASNDNYVNDAMRFGMEQEPFARAAFEVATGTDVDQTGFYIHPVLDFSGASPDGLIGDDGLLEIKVPNTVTHLQYLMDGVPPKDYRPQMTWQMVCTERTWCQFVSYDPRLPEHLQLFTARYELDTDYAQEIGEAVILFNEEIEALAKSLPQPEEVHV